MERVIVFVRSLNHPYSMWISGKFDQQSQRDMLFQELIDECRKRLPGRQLNYSLQCKLNRLSLRERAELVNRHASDGCTPLFLACKKGTLEIVRYLIEDCNADPEIRGRYQMQDDQSIHIVTPLWAASVSGHVEVVRYLVLNVKVDVNAVSDTGSTPLRSACFMTHYEIVKFLIENGADISKTNHNGGTCLINSIQSIELCELLLKNGADINAQDIQMKTALHYAIQEHRLETTVLLLKYGADPTIKSRLNGDALQTACLKLAHRIVSYLINNFNYSNERIACAYELMGCTFLDEHMDIQNAVKYWEMALQIRLNAEPRPILKRNAVEPKKAYDYMREFTTYEEFNQLECNVDEMRIQSLLMCERILGPMHKELLFRLMYRGAFYADNFDFDRCIHLWNYAFRLRVQKDTILPSDSCYTSVSLTNLYLDFFESQLQQDNDRGMRRPPNFSDIMETLQIIVENTQEATELLKIRPMFKNQIDNFDTLMKVIVNLLSLLNRLEKDGQQQLLLHEMIARLQKLNLRDSIGNSILHLSVSPQMAFHQVENKLKNSAPDPRLVGLLLQFGFDPEMTNMQLNTPLHFACIRSNYNREIVRLLLDAGAHLDRMDVSGNQPVKMLHALKEPIRPMQYISLKCLSARKVAKQRLIAIETGRPVPEIPAFLSDFVDIH